MSSIDEIKSKIDIVDLVSEEGIVAKNCKSGKWCSRFEQTGRILRGKENSHMVALFGIRGSICNLADKSKMKIAL